MLPRPLAFLLLSGAVLTAQDTYFKEPEKKWWLPKWEVDVYHEYVDLDPGRHDIRRYRGRLRLRFELGGDDEWIQFRVGSKHLVGSDGNKNNLKRFDNERSNGSELDLADLRVQWLRESGGVELHGGFIESPLIASESLLDPDLRLTGGSGRFFFRWENGWLDEIGLRAVSGNLKLIERGQVRMDAAHLVAKVSTGAVSWTAFGGPWRLQARQEDLSKFQRQNPVGSSGYAEDSALTFNLITYGLAVDAAWTLPVEVKLFQHQNQDTKEKGNELQIFIGSRTKKWWPQVGFVHQRMAPTSQLASVNGDIWWFHANADGNRYVASLALPKKWLFSYSYIEQTRRGATAPVYSHRAGFSKRF